MSTKHKKNNLFMSESDFIMLAQNLQKQKRKKKNERIT